MTTLLFCIVIAVLFCIGMLGVVCTAALEVMENRWRLLLGSLTLLVFVSIVVLCVLAVVGIVV